MSPTVVLLSPPPPPPPSARQALHNVLHSKQVTDIWEELGLVEMPDTWDTHVNRLGGSCVTNDLDDEFPDAWPKQPRLC